MMHAQAQTSLNQAAPIASNIVRFGVRSSPATHARSQEFSSHSNSFVTGRTLCARAVRHASSRAPQSTVRADVFYTQKSVPDQTGRVAIVTGTLAAAFAFNNLQAIFMPAASRLPFAGSSSGMGFEIAKCLSQRNATVIIAARNKQKCEK